MRRPARGRPCSGRAEAARWSKRRRPANSARRKEELLRVGGRRPGCLRTATAQGPLGLHPPRRAGGLLRPARGLCREELNHSVNPCRPLLRGAPRRSRARHGFWRVIQARVLETISVGLTPKLHDMRELAPQCFHRGLSLLLLPLVERELLAQQLHLRPWRAQARPRCAQTGSGRVQRRPGRAQAGPRCASAVAGPRRAQLAAIPRSVLRLPGLDAGVQRHQRL
mmetsp:Transcript_61122/g.147843  ORF Transcript_61122/g.147843 Transcript_61122/m.147843 type:complete len:224 (+) Transcript_61122:463-1134(+)